MDKIRAFGEYLVTYWYYNLLSIGSFIYGAILYSHPDILNTYRAYRNIAEIADGYFFGGFFMALGVGSVVVNLIKEKRFKKYILVLHVFVWSFFGTSFVLTVPRNTVGVLAFVMAGIAFGVSWRGDFTGK